jgi:hypothetical protein
MTKSYIKLLPAVLLALLLVSCKSAPAAVDAGGEIPDFVVKARTTADDARTKAVEVKAAVAAKDLFTQADTEYTAAKEFETAKSFDQAAAGYTTAGDSFNKAFTEASAKREKALASMGAADAERKQSEEALQAADAEVSGAAAGGTAQ